MRVGARPQPHCLAASETPPTLLNTGATTIAIVTRHAHLDAFVVLDTTELEATNRVTIVEAAALARLGLGRLALGRRARTVRRGSRRRVRRTGGRRRRRHGRGRIL